MSLYGKNDKYGTGYTTSIYWYYVNDPSNGQLSGKPTILQTTIHNTDSSNPGTRVAPGEYIVYLFDGSNGNDYNGQIITPDELREFTKQETNIDTEGYTINKYIYVNTETVPDYDVSDQTMTNRELYDKVLDIIYHRHLAVRDPRFKDLTVEEIRFVTEIALKNYLNARITTYETDRVLNGTKIAHVAYNANGELWKTGDGTKYYKIYKEKIFIYKKKE